MQDTSLDRVSLRWIVRDILANRHILLRPNDAQIERLIELGWIEMQADKPFVTHVGRRALEEHSI